MADSLVKNIQGYVLIGYMLHVLLGGIIVAQFYMYYVTRFKRDKTWLKIFIVVLLLLNFLNTLFMSGYVYTALILHFNEPEHLRYTDWWFLTDGFLTAVLTIMVQLFFAWRILVLTRNPLLVGLVGLTAFASFAGGVVASTGSIVQPEFEKFKDFNISVTIWLVAAMCTDLMITLILVRHLHTHKTGIQGTDELIDRIIKGTVQTGLVTSVFAVINLVAFLAVNSGLHFVFNLALAKLYTNMLLSSLNARGGWHYNSDTQPQTHPGGATTATSRRKNGIINLTNTRPEVFVQVEEVQDADPNINSSSTKAHRDDFASGLTSLWDSEVRKGDTYELDHRPGSQV